MTAPHTHPLATRRTWLARSLACGLLPGMAGLLGPAARAAAPAARPAPADGPLVEIWKGPTCGCCHDWIAHLESQGFRTRSHDTGNTAARQRLGVAIGFGSCHTGLVGGYAIEGHVPAADIRRLLAERPTAIGLAVPGMPVGSPGMDGPAYGSRRDPYDVLLLTAGGGSQVWARYR